ncbi:hypothetical protein PENTCL1PPCAC_7733, partial [Pristionchus entomophagus]
KVSADFIVRRMLNNSYDVRMRPPSKDQKGNNAPVVVNANILIQSVSDIDFISMQYDAKITLREYWKVS